jgi:hypothetical protein
VEIVPKRRASVGTGESDGPLARRLHREEWLASGAIAAVIDLAVLQQLRFTFGAVPVPSRISRTSDAPTPLRDYRCQYLQSIPIGFQILHAARLAIHLARLREHGRSCSALL